MGTFNISAIELRYFFFPAVLLAYYLFFWFRIGRDPKLDSVAPEYQPPAGVTPAVARYVLTGGSDGTTLAAILASLASRKVIEISQSNGTTTATLLDSNATVMPDEAVVLKQLFQLELVPQAYPVSGTNIVGKPAQQKQSLNQVINAEFNKNNAMAGPGTSAPRQHVPVAVGGRLHLDMEPLASAIQDTLRKNLQGIYFKWNFGIIGIGMFVTLIWALATAVIASPMGGSSFFLTIWLYFFSTTIFTVVCMTWRSQPHKAKTAFNYIVFLSWILAAAVFIAYRNGGLSRAGFPVALTLSALLSSIFLLLMRAPTDEGRRLQQHVAGFREFLVRVDQDRLDRMTSAEERAATLDKFMPYAIALGVKEAWGDQMALEFWAAGVQR